MIQGRAYYGEILFPSDTLSSPKPRIRASGSDVQDFLLCPTAEDRCSLWSGLRPCLTNDFIRAHVGDYLKKRIWDVTPEEIPRVQHYVLRRIVNMEELIMNPLGFSVPGGWVDNLNAFYDDEKNEREARIETSRVYYQHLYAWKNVVNGMWFRVRVDELDLVNSTANVTLIDEGIPILVTLDELRELSAQFWSIPAMAWKFKLYDINPPKGMRDWPETSLQRLCDLCKPGEILVGMLPASCDAKNLRPLDSGVSVILFKADAEESVQDCLIYELKASCKYTNTWDSEFVELPLHFQS